MEQTSTAARAAATPASARARRNPHLTERENRGAGRHGWLRLTPAYSYRLVAEELDAHARDACGREAQVVLDPFSGSGTTGLVAAERGLRAHLVDVNPFLTWFADVKTRTVTDGEAARAREVGAAFVAEGRRLDPEGRWAPALHRIERWWAPRELDALRILRHLLDEAREPPPVLDLLRVALCRTLIEVSNAAFDHQSMSFRSAEPEADGGTSVDAAAWEVWQRSLARIVDAAVTPLPGAVRAHLADARDLAACVPEPVDLLATSPPYANRMSYVRELRPYMYWLRYLTDPADAGELDWRAIGGTWGVATSRVGAWEPAGPSPLDAELARAGAAIRVSGGRNADLLARYVHKYAHDMWRHFRSAAEVVRPGGRLVYIVGNSTFFGEVVPVQDWYAALLAEAGMVDVDVRAIRKRNSNKALYEYAVTATRP